ncbi:helix-turn-helix domain-containing protein [Simiduia agarivorans]|uniref:Cro/CI family transcriptional regulator n=1 Tax=Simiduia agarivorans (strain DSM 21679 / JCM 13881 / BCRC 17597 / SA1) TaxID=1117647 RepID=K4KFF4_SIMAS|nr:helix-turn-helix transcriptional regulator [Simiduia agarivorans]AFU97804.1 Cro/CI family transcriptional regulator [Simiduia agarivorans SA1 = DSM 21679]
MHDIAVALGQHVRRLRKQRGLSQEQLAHLARLDRSYMSRIERGLVSITIDKLYNLAGALHCAPADLLPPSPSQDPSSA